MPEAVAPIQRLSALADTKSEKARTAMGAPQYVDVDASVAFNGYHDSQNVLGMADVPVAQEEPIKMRVLLVDNYDSYTYNLLQICEDAADLDSPVVIRNDQFDWARNT
ncbi:hypothetical protein BC829DRAFT_444985 [Chytridium lagenaria]|nr:hypothetical protein BC829DRAFT_444985 [Chytridium lagenaria]